MIVLGVTLRLLVGGVARTRVTGSGARRGAWAGAVLVMRSPAARSGRTAHVPLSPLLLVLAAVDPRRAPFGRRLAAAPLEAAWQALALVLAVALVGDLAVACAGCRSRPQTRRLEHVAGASSASSATSSSPSS